MSRGAVVLDVEGTTGSAAHVRDVLFPYARERLPGWIAEHRGTPEWAAVLADIRQHVGDGTLDESGALRVLTTWMDDDVKAPPLKTLQGLIWDTGYADGSLFGHVYDDVPGALRAWQESGASLYIYSSGSVSAQTAWFAHTPHGDLTPLLSGYFDLSNAGGKKEPGSYRIISRAIGVPPEATLFLSDSGEELEAAAAAGWRTVAVRRPDDPRPGPVPGHPTVRSLAEVAPGLLVAGPDN